MIYLASVFNMRSAINANKCTHGFNNEVHHKLDFLPKSISQGVLAIIHTMAVHAAQVKKLLKVNWCMYLATIIIFA